MFFPDVQCPVSLADILLHQNQNWAFDRLSAQKLFSLHMYDDKDTKSPFENKNK